MFSRLLKWNILQSAKKGSKTRSANTVLFYIINVPFLWNCLTIAVFSLSPHTLPNHFWFIKPLKSNDWLIPCESCALFLGNWRMRKRTRAEDDLSVYMWLVPVPCWGIDMEFAIIDKEQRVEAWWRCVGEKSSTSQSSRLTQGLQEGSIFFFQAYFLWPVLSLWFSLALTCRIRGSVSLVAQWETEIVQKLRHREI